MGLLNKTKPIKNAENSTATQLVSTNTYAYMYDTSYNGKDVVMSALRPITQNVGKLNPVLHNTDNKNTYGTVAVRNVLVNPCVTYSMQKILEFLALQRTLYGNGFALILRDVDGNPIQIIPLFAVSAKATTQNGVVYVQITDKQGKRTVYKYTDLIHIRREPDGGLFGVGLTSAINTLMEAYENCDYSVKTAVRNANNMRWMLKFEKSLPDDHKSKFARKFASDFLENAKTGGVGYVDPGYTAEPLKVEPYVPDFNIMTQLHKRVYELFGVSENILQNKATDSEANAFYENVIEPIALELSNELTLKLLTPEQRRKGCKIICESNNLYCLSMEVKLQMVQLVDRGVLTPNELREIMGKAPIQGGDKALLRKDTGTLTAANNVN